MTKENSLDTSIERLIEILNLEMIEKNIFRGESQDIGSPQVFGGLQKLEDCQCPDFRHERYFSQSSLG